MIIILHTKPKNTLLVIVINNQITDGYFFPCSKTIMIRKKSNRTLDYNNDNNRNSVNKTYFKLTSPKATRRFINLKIVRLKGCQFL